MSKSQVKIDKKYKNIYYCQEKKNGNEKRWISIFCMNIDSEKFIGLNINNLNMNYPIKKFLVSENKDYKIKFYNKVLTENKENTFRKNSHYNNLKYIKNYYSYIERYCKQYKLEIVYESESNNFIRMNSYKLIVGLGNPSVLETSITLHPIYGIPYIPGQSIKGTVRNYFLNIYYDMENKKFHNISTKKENKYEVKALYKLIFGNDIEGDNNRKGGIVFFDLFPSINEEILMETDVMTPHYDKYYSGKGLPKDSDDPNPISFYVLKNTSFDFLIAVDKKIYDKYKNECKKVNREFIEYGEFKKFVSDLLKRTLKESGLGSKTAVGYGHFI